MPIVLRRHITPDDLWQNRRFDDFAAHWIYNQLAPSAGRILSEGWQAVQGSQTVPV